MGATLAEPYACASPYCNMGNNCAPARRCEQILECGHQCGGCAAEFTLTEMFSKNRCAGECFGCVNEACASHVADERCPVCLDTMEGGPAMRLHCGHAVHGACVNQMIDSVEWKGKLITPAALRCPSGCGQLIAHQLLEKRVAPMMQLIEKARAVSRQSASEDGTPDMTDRELEAKYSAYQCVDCGEAFSGGLRECDVESDNEDKRPAVCGACQRKGGKSCRKHGQEFMEAKCNYCCQVATFNCGGGQYLFCTPCHVRAAVAFHQGKFGEWERNEIPRIPSCDPATCPFGGKHPPGVTYGWRTVCTKCHLVDKIDEIQGAEAGEKGAKVAAERAPRQCDTPGCSYMAHGEPAPWNGHGRYCCAGCMEHAAQTTLRPPPHPPPPTHCHEGRCSRSCHETTVGAVGAGATTASSAGDVLSEEEELAAAMAASLAIMEEEEKAAKAESSHMRPGDEVVKGMGVPNEEMLMQTHANMMECAEAPSPTAQSA